MNCLFLCQYNNDLAPFSGPLSERMCSGIEPLGYPGPDRGLVFGGLNRLGFHPISEYIDRVPGLVAPGDLDRQALAGGFIDHHQKLDGATVIGPVEHEVPGPHRVGPQG